MRVLQCFLISAALLALRVDGPAADTEQRSVKVEVLMVAVKPSTSVTLLPKLRKKESFDNAFQELWKMIERDEADLIGWPIISTGSGEYVTSQAVEEVRYPIETDPPQEPGGRFRRVPEPTHYDWNSVFWSMGRGDMTPTAFETRNIGQKLEVEASVPDDSDRIALSLVVEDLRFVKFHDFPGVKAVNGVKGKTVTPEFASSKFTGPVTARNGRWRLLSSFVESSPEPRVTLFLLRATTIPGAPAKSTR